MSYEQISPEVYQVYQPETPWQPGAKGWWRAPIPGWGENPNLLDTHVKAIHGLGCSGARTTAGLGCAGGCGCKGTGETATPAPTATPELPGWGVAAVILVTMAAGVLLLRKSR